MEPAEIREKLKALGVPQSRIAAAIKRAQPQATRLLAGTRSIKANEVTPLLKLITEFEQEPSERDSAYARVEVLPTFAGAGGGGNGDADQRTALVPRALIENELHGKPGDFLLIDVRGDSMEPDFYQGDQILVDKRDCSPAQPGPFALWDGEWGEYVVKNIERAGEGLLRIFSSNKKYNPATVTSENTKIIGRPVWVGRRL